MSGGGVTVLSRIIDIDILLHLGTHAFISFVAALLQGDNAKRAKLTTTSDTTVGYLVPIY